MNEQIPLEKVLQMYGKVCLEKEIAFEHIEELQRENASLKEQLDKKEKENEHNN